MSSDLDCIASFSRDVRQFAFQANILQKNVIDIYPLDAANNYNVNSSLVSHIDYEANDLKASEISFAGWCSGSAAADKQRVKRKNSDDTGLVDGDGVLDNFFISVQESGKIVCFSSSGKNIVNIIQSRSDILHASLHDSFIWTLDDEKTVRKFQYNQTKQLRSFHLTDGKDAEIVYFELKEQEGLLYLCYASKDTLYIVDPTKRRPTLVGKVPANNCKSCELLGNSRIAIATTESVLVYNYKTDETEQEWEMQAKSLKVVKDIILCQGLANNISGYRAGSDATVFQAKVSDAHLLDFAQVENGIMIAWLNVNEPNFKLLSLDDLIDNHEIVIKGQTDAHKESSIKENSTTENGEFEQETVGGNAEGEEEEDEEETNTSKKITKAEQIELSRSLVSALESEDNVQIINLVKSDAWNEPKIKSFIITQTISESSLTKLFELTTSELQKHPWEDNENLSLWLKWLLTLKSALYFDSQSSKHAKKHTKRLRSTLKNSKDTLPVLLGIQGRLEMLKRQAQLREDLVQLSLTEDEEDGDVDTIVHGTEKERLQASGDQDDSIVYANGESDTFVDASEFTDMK